MFQILNGLRKAMLLVITLSVLANDVAAMAEGEVCEAAIQLPLESTLRSYSGAGDEVGLFSLEIPSPGLLSIDAMVLASAKGSPKIGFLGRGCSIQSLDPDVATVERSAASQILAFRAPGHYFIRVASQDPQVALGEYRLTARFVAAEVVNRRFELVRGFAYDSLFYPSQYGKSEEEEVDPNPKIQRSYDEPILQLTSFYTGFFGKSEEEEVDPNPKAAAQPDAQIVLFANPQDRSRRKSEEEEVDPNPKRLRDVRLLHGSMTRYRASDVKSEEEEVDPNPKSVEEEVDPNPKSEEEEVDPNPKAGTRDRTERQVTLAVADDFGRQELGDDRGGFVKWLADLVWAEATTTSRGVAREGRFRLLSSSSASEVVAPRLELPALCRPVGLDDHPDTFGCATPLELDRSVMGEIGNDWSDDADTFALTLNTMRTVAIETTGSTDTYGGIYDRFGRLLAADDDGGEGNNFRLIKTLVPGRYFIRVEGSNRAEGAYDLVLEQRDW